MCSKPVDSKIKKKQRGRNIPNFYPMLIERRFIMYSMHKGAMCLMLDGNNGDYKLT